jgi:hypothetical protein
MTSYADAMLAHPHVARELRCYRGLELPAARLLGAAFGDAGFVEAGLAELVERGFLIPVRHAPWMGTPIIVPSFAFGCGMGKGKVDRAPWRYRVSHAMEWVYRVADGTEKPVVEEEAGLYDQWKPEAREAVRELTEVRDWAKSQLDAAWVRWERRQTRRAWLRREKWHRRWVTALDAWRAVAMQAANLL